MNQNVPKFSKEVVEQFLLFIGYRDYENGDKLELSKLLDIVETNGADPEEYKKLMVYIGDYVKTLIK